MKKRICLLGIGSVILLCNIVLLIHYGYFGDTYPNVKVDNSIIYCVWISLVVTIAVMGVILRNIISRTQTGRLSEILAMLCLICLIGLNLYQDGRYYRLVNNKRINTENQDYISSEYFSGISLAELKTDLNADEKMVIYIGENSKKCSVFEKQLEGALQECRVELPTYYTSQDKEGKNNKEMQQLLEEYGVTSVPAVIVTQNSKLEKIWSDADKHLDEIRSCIKKVY